MFEVLFALLPMVILVISMGICKWPGDKSSLLTLVITVMLATFAFGIPTRESSICSIIIIIAWSRWTEKSDTIPTKHSPREIYQARSVYGLIIFFILLAIPFNFRATSLLLFTGAFIGGRIQGVSTSRQFKLLGKTLVQIRSTIIMVIALMPITRPRRGNPKTGFPLCTRVRYIIGNYRLYGVIRKQERLTIPLYRNHFFFQIIKYITRTLVIQPRGWITKPFECF